MKSVLLKLDDQLFAETDKLVKAVRMSRSGYIKTAIEHYNKWQAKKALEEQLVREVQLLNEFDPDKELKDEFESASLHDLQKHLED